MKGAERDIVTLTTLTGAYQLPTRINDRKLQVRSLLVALKTRWFDGRNVQSGFGMRIADKSADLRVISRQNSAPGWTSTGKALRRIKAATDPAHPALL